MPNTATKHDFRDPRDLPNYAIPEAARYLRLPASTVRAWALGMGSSFRPVFPVAQKNPPVLSFYNLVEAHVLGSIRDRVRLPRIRTALHYVERELCVSRPLINKKFKTDGISLFVDHCGCLLNVSEHGQVAMGEMLHEYLERVDFDRDDLAVRLFPFTRRHRTANESPTEDPRAVVFDPNLSFGRLVVAGTGIAAATIADRFLAGDTIDDLVRDFRIERRFVEEAIRCESLLTAA